jgi:hypothetical protein
MDIAYFNLNEGAVLSTKGRRHRPRQTKKMTWSARITLVDPALLLKYSKEST